MAGPRYGYLAGEMGMAIIVKAKSFPAHLPGRLLGMLPGVWRASRLSRSAAAVTAAVGQVIHVRSHVPRSAGSIVAP